MTPLKTQNWPLLNYKFLYYFKKKNISWQCNLKNKWFSSQFLPNTILDRNEFITWWDLVITHLFLLQSKNRSTLYLGGGIETFFFFFYKGIEQSTYKFAQKRQEYKRTKREKMSSLWSWYFVTKIVLTYCEKKLF